MRTEVGSDLVREEEVGGVGIGGGRAACPDRAWPGDKGRHRAPAAGSAGRRGPGSERPGWASAGAAPTCAGRPQAQVAEVAQAAGLGLRGGFSITTSPAQERAGRGAAPGAAGARAGPGWGRGAILGRARARARARAPRGPLPTRPWGLGEPRRPGALARRRPRAQAPGSPGAAPASAAPRPPSAARPRTHRARPSGPRPRTPAGRRATGMERERRGRGGRAGSGAEEAACGAPAAALPGVLVERRGARGVGGNNSSRCFSTAHTVPGAAVNPSHALVLTAALCSRRGDRPQFSWAGAQVQEGKATCPRSQVSGDLTLEPRCSLTPTLSSNTIA